jgi:hypothetical protein
VVRIQAAGSRSRGRPAQAFKGAEFGWAKMFKQLAAVVARLAADRK